MWVEINLGVSQRRRELLNAVGWTAPRQSVCKVFCMVAGYRLLEHESKSNNSIRQLKTKCGKDKFHAVLLMRRLGYQFLLCFTLLPVSAGFGVAERSEAQATSGRAKVGRGCEAQRSEAIPNRTESGF